MGVALLVSALWHLVGIASITIVSFPPSVQFPRLSEISFVGSILREADFEIHLSQLPFSRRPEEVIQPFLERSGRLLSTPLTTPAFWTTSRANIAPLEGTLPLSDELFLHQRSSPLLFPEHLELPQEKETYLLEGPASHRVLYYRPERPQLPRWVDAREIQTELQFKFWISPDGKVASIEKVISSGDPTVDLMGMRYLRRWQFNPKEDGVEWGVVSFSLPPPSNQEKESP